MRNVNQKRGLKFQYKSPEMKILKKKLLVFGGLIRQSEIEKAAEIKMSWVKYCARCNSVCV